LNLIFEIIDFDHFSMIKKNSSMLLPPKITNS